jgi:AraC-like DNA-binding protein
VERQRELVSTLWPSPALAPFVRRYRFRECDQVAEPTTILSPARATQFIEFYLEDQYEVEDVVGGQRFRAAPSALVGLQAVTPIRLIRSGRLRNFTIVFRPTAFHELFGFPMSEVAGTSIDLETVCLPGLRERIGNCQSFESAVQEVEATLHPYVALAESRRTDQSRWLRSIAEAPYEGMNLDAWLARTPVGSRQVQRLFQQQVGVSPKRFWRVRRFETALRTRQAKPSLTWGEIAADLGYHDQMHLVHDFRELAGSAPTVTLDRMSDSY